MGKKIKLGFIGHGLRGYLIKFCAKMADVDLTAVCDMHPDRANQMAKIVEEITDYTRAGAVISFSGSDYLVEGSGHSIKNGIHYVKLDLRRWTA